MHDDTHNPHPQSQAGQYVGHIMFANEKTGQGYQQCGGQGQSRSRPGPQENPQENRAYRCIDGMAGGEGRMNGLGKMGDLKEGILYLGWVWAGSPQTKLDQMHQQY